MTAPPRPLDVVADDAAVAEAGAEELAARAAAAVAARGTFTLVLTGGRTPKRLYELLATPRWRARVPWDRTHAFVGDERGVPPDHPDSNFGMARAALLRHLQLAGVHRMEGELPADEAAARYEQVLRRFAAGEGPPRFDLLLLGLGADGHVASLFPGIPALAERARWVVATAPPQPGPRRITLTFPVIEAAGRVLFLVAGASKAEAVRRVLAGEPLPATWVHERGRDVRWILDRAAAGEG